MATPPKPAPGQTGAGDPKSRNYPIEHLRIAECIFTRRAVMIATVLGSCVSATFYHRPTHTGAICHAMLPECCNRLAQERSCRYADVAVEEIMRRFERVGIPASRLEVHLFGGGFTIEPERKSAVRDIVDVGRKNVEAARTALARHGLKILSEDVLGSHGRKVLFLVATGEIWCRRISETSGDLDPAMF